MLLPIGDEGFEISVVASGLGGPPRGTGIAHFDAEFYTSGIGKEIMTVDPGPKVDEGWPKIGLRELGDLRAFQAAGWEFWLHPQLPWGSLQSKTKEVLSAGLLARTRLGGLVVVRNKLLLHLADTPDAGEILGEFESFEKLGYGDGLYEASFKASPVHLSEMLGEKLQRLNSDGEPRVLKAEPSVLYHLSWPGRVHRPQYFQAPQWHWEKIQLKDSWELATKKKGRGIRVGVIDLGFQPESSEFEQRVSWKIHVDERTGQISKQNPPDGHGTLCAGLIGAADDGARVHGAAPECELAFISINSNGVASQEGLAKAICIAVDGPAGHEDEPVDIISISLAWRHTGWPIADRLKEAIAYAHDKGRPDADSGEARGTPIVWATYNKESEIVENSVHSYDSLIVVSSSDRNDELYESSYGKGLDLLAPGRGIPILQWKEGLEESWKASGASTATPIVAGVIALILAEYPKLTWDQVAQAITKNSPSAQWMRKKGWGRLDAVRSLEKAKELAGSGPPDS